MRGYVVVRLRNGFVWWWFFTIPYRFSVWWQPDRSKTMNQFALEQAAKVRNYLLATGDSTR